MFRGRVKAGKKIWVHHLKIGGNPISTDRAPGKKIPRSPYYGRGLGYNPGWGISRKFKSEIARSEGIRRAGETRGFTKKGS